MWLACNVSGSVAGMSRRSDSILLFHQSTWPSLDLQTKGDIVRRSSLSVVFASSVYEPMRYRAGHQAVLDNGAARTTLPARPPRERVVEPNDGRPFFAADGLRWTWPRLGRRSMAPARCPLAL